MTKRLVSAVVAVALLFGSAAALPQAHIAGSTGITASADTLEGNYYYQTLSDGTAELTYYAGKETKVTIPSTIGGKKVTSIGRSAFQSKAIEEVVIPSGVTNIGRTAFSACKSLKKVKMPNTVKTLGDYCFERCDVLTSINLSTSLKRIPYGAFECCWILPSIVIPDSVTELGEHCFECCKAMKSITLSKNLVTVGEFAFFNCFALESVKLPDSVKTIDDMAFNGCKALETIKLPASLEQVGEMVFEYTPWLEKTLAKNKTLYVNNVLVLVHRKYKGKFIVPEGTKAIAGTAFYTCGEITCITLPNSVKSIGNGAFSLCSKLKEIDIPNSVTYIGNSAFRSAGLSKIEIPESVKTIGDYAFWGCSLSKALMPRTVITIGNAAFSASPNGFKLYCFAGTDAFKYAVNNNINYEFYPSDTRIAGKDRYNTSALISKRTYTTADTVILAYSMNYADALAGVPLAKTLSAPILLTNTNVLSEATVTEIKRLGAKNVIILGGESVISKNVERKLGTLGLKTERIGGKTRYETATMIAERLREKPSNVFFVYANSYADALSVSTVAARKRAPIIYLNTNGEMQADTAKYLAELKKKKCVENAYVIGGEAVISDDMLKKAGAAVGATKCVRVSGANRYSTCIKVNKTFAKTFNGTEICVATGLDFPDALAGGVFAANKAAPMFLVSNMLSAEQKEYLSKKGAKSFYVLGGTGAVSDEITYDISKACV